MDQSDDASGSHHKLRVGIACNIKTEHASDAQAEFDEPETIAGIRQALLSGGFDSFTLEATTGFPEKLETEKPDIVFNIAEGVSGRSREAQVPAILDYYGIPYVGSDAAALAIALDKALTKRIVRDAGISTPPFALIRKEEVQVPEDLIYPVLVKPNAEGSSKGISDISVAADKAALQNLVARDMQSYQEDLLAESYIDGREFTVGLLGNGADVHVFEPMEVIYRKLRGAYRIYSYEVKRNYRDYISYACPPNIPEELNREMKQAAAEVFQVLGCRDFARMDFRLSKENKLYFIEANPLPGLAPGYSDYPMLAGFNGVSYNEIVCDVLRQALLRCGMKADIL